MAEKFHIGARRIYEIWNNSERLQQGLILSSSDQPALDKNFQTDKTEQTLEATEIPKKNARKKKVKIDGKPVTEATSMEHSGHLHFITLLTIICRSFI